MTVRVDGSELPLARVTSDEMHQVARWSEAAARWRFTPIGTVELEFEAVLIDEHGLVVARPVAPI